MKRREFLKGSLAASALTTVSTAAADSKGTQEYYQLRVYRLKPDSNHDLLGTYLQNAAIPALNRLGSKPVGAFTEIESKEAPAVYLLVPYATLEAFAGVAAGLRQDA